MSEIQTREVTEADLESVTEIFDWHSRNGIATFL